MITSSGKDLSNLTLAQVEEQWKDGRLEYHEAVDYIREWNAGPHFTQAYIWCGRVRNIDPEQSWVPVGIKKRFGFKECYL